LFCTAPPVLTVEADELTFVEVVLAVVVVVDALVVVDAVLVIVRLEDALVDVLAVVVELPVKQITAFGTVTP
jgi:hypothetical protein